MIGITVVVGILLIIITIITANQITGPIKRMTYAMGEIANGNTEIPIPGQSRKNEIGLIAKTVEIFRLGVLEKEQLQTEQAESQKRPMMKNEN